MSTMQEETPSQNGSGTHDPEPGSDVLFVFVDEHRTVTGRVDVHHTHHHSHSWFRMPNWLPSWYWWNPMRGFWVALALIFAMGLAAASMALADAGVFDNSKPSTVVTTTSAGAAVASVNSQPLESLPPYGIGINPVKTSGQYGRVTTFADYLSARGFNPKVAHRMVGMPMSDAVGSMTIYLNAGSAGKSTMAISLPSGTAINMRDGGNVSYATARFDYQSDALYTDAANSNRLNPNTGGQFKLGVVTALNRLALNRLIAGNSDFGPSLLRNVTLVLPHSVYKMLTGQYSMPGPNTSSDTA